MNTKRLICTVGVIDTLDIFTYAMLPEFQALGYEVLIFDTARMEESLPKLAAFIEKPVTAMLCFNNLGFNMELVPGKNIWDDLNIPVINILMDHPYMHKAALDHAPRNAVVLVIDRNHLTYLQRFYPHISTIGFLPHGGSDDHITPKPIAERSIGILYAGGISLQSAAQHLPDFSAFSFPAKEIAEEALDLLIQKPDTTVEAALEERLLSHGVALSDPELCAVIEKLHYIDMLAVSHYREKVIRMLAESGLSIALYGRGWDSLDWVASHKYSSLHYHGLVSSYEIVEKMQDTKIVLSTMTWFKDGTHDRVFNGMLNGAVAVTDTSRYMAEHFCGFYDGKGADERELVFFTLPEIDRLPDMLKDLLQAPDACQAIADRGFRRASERESWQARARELHQDLLSQLP